MCGGQRGITLIEILIVLTIALVVAGMAMPWFLGTIEAYRLRVAAWEFVGDLRLARQKSVTMQVRHRICLFDCSTSVPGAAYILERQDSTDPTGWRLDVARTDLADGVVITTNGPQGKIEFGMKGEPFQTLGTSSRLTNGSGTYQVTVASTGRVRVCKGAC